MAYDDFKDGDRVRYIGANNPMYYNKIGTVTSALDEDVQFDGMSTNYSPFRHNLELVSGVRSASLGSAPLTVEDVWTVGNVIQFTVEAVVTDQAITVGCKTGRAVDVFSSIKEMASTSNPERRKVTFEAEIVEKDGYDYGVILIPGAGHNWIDKFDALDYFKDIKLVKEAEPAKPDVTINLTADQYDKLISAMGALQGTMTTDVYRALIAQAGRASGKYRLNKSKAGYTFLEHS